ncbi:fungal-specific transcription factor domain-containing protein [Xylariaceae sp. FL1019]|nr:fungal-specific transcription factor domain-containing protein [Xylariaceae sp. FL1019]
MKHACLYPFDARAMGQAAVTPKVKATQACLSCRKQKRKCDKSMPSCALCTRMSRFCDYSDTPPNPTVEDIEALRARLAELETKLQDAVRHSDTGSISPPNDDIYRNRSSSSYTPSLPWQYGANTFDPTLFLDAKLFEDMNISPVPPAIDIPSSVLQFLGNPEHLQNLLDNYFSEVHPWFPLIPKKRASITSPLWNGSPETTLLLLSMMLMVYQPPDGMMPTPRNILYDVTKQYAMQLESSGTASLHYLQALVLISLYEYSQVGIYPNAFMGVGQCQRYADFVGLPSYKDSNSTLGPCMTWVDAEERRRTWWAVYILDKIVCLGSGKRSLCCEPARNEMLPVSDEAWDSGDASLAVQYTISSPSTDLQSPFARLCQVAMFLGETLKHCQDARILASRREPPNRGDASSLIETAFGFSMSLHTEVIAQPKRYFSIVPTHCLIYSALFKIISTHSPDLSCVPAPIPGLRDSPWPNDTLATQIMAIEAKKKTVAGMHQMASDINTCTSHKGDLARVSPFVLDALYDIGVAYSWWTEQDHECASATSLEMVKKCLVRIGGRWGLSSEYLTLLEQHEMTVMSAANYTISLPGTPFAVTSMGV